jgi:hypothetical protein
VEAWRTGWTGPQVLVLRGISINDAEKGNTRMARCGPMRIRVDGEMRDTGDENLYPARHVSLRYWRDNNTGMRRMAQGSSRW